MDGGSLVSKSITWMLSGNLYLVDSRWANSAATLLKDGAGCEDWVILVSKSSLNSTNVQEILGSKLSFQGCDQIKCSGLGLVLGF